MSAETAGEIPEGLDGSGLRVAVVRSTFNGAVTQGLLDGALAVCRATGADVTVVDVPGAFELPLVAQRLAASGFVAVVAVGAVIRGETDHYEHIAHRVSEGLMRVMLDTGVPVGFGVLTVTNVEDAVRRSAPGAGNKGAEAAIAALTTARLLASLTSR